MEALKAKKPELKNNRFKALLYGYAGVGKTHFVCSIPNSYFIDTEGVLKYKFFVDLLNSNNSDAVEMIEMSEIINEVKKLMTLKHDYKTLIIDSITCAYAMLGNMEAERLINQSKYKIEGTEFGANLAKPKRLAFHLGMLLSRLDMNVIVIAHEKSKFENGQELGKTFDINEKMAFSLGAVIQLKLLGKSRYAYVEKSRYEEIPNKDSIPFDDGYEVLKERFGEDIFIRNVKTEKFATTENLTELKRLIDLLSVPEEKVQKFITSCSSMTIDECPNEKVEKYINHLKSQLNGDK